MDFIKIIFSIVFTALSIGCLVSPQYIPLIILPKIWLIWSVIKLWLVRFNGESLGFPLSEFKNAGLKKGEVKNILHGTDFILVVISLGILFIIINF